MILCYLFRFEYLATVVVTISFYASNFVWFVFFHNPNNSLSVVK